MIHIQIHDTIVDIVEKIESQTSWDIILDFPLWHPILHNYISLKILKSKAWDRKFIIATNDKIGKKIGRQLWIEYSIVKDSKFYETNLKNKLMEHNFTFWEYFKFQVRSYIWELRSLLHTNKKINSLTKYSQKYNEKPSTYIFIWWLLLSIILFLFIYYFAISKTYIYITPEIVIKKEAHNFIFNENSENSILWNNKKIKISKIIQKISLNETYSSTEILNNQFDTAKWKIRIYNELPEDVSLVPNTRFQTSQWIIYETLQWVNIPPAVQDNFWEWSPGTVEIEVQSKTKDASWKYIWSRWNISSDVLLFLPGLPIKTQELIYGRSIEDFSWWIDDFQKVVSQEDLDIALALFQQKLKDNVLKQLKNTISLENSTNGTLIDILSWEDAITYWDPEIIIQEWVEVWSLTESFTLSWSISISAYTYNKESIIQKLKTLISEKKMDGIEKISHIDISSLRMSEILYTQKQPFELKATFEIESLFLHDFLSAENTYTDILRSKIRWLPKDNAEKILLNDPRISNVEIKIRPFFISWVSNIYNNIIFKVR